MEKNNMAKNNGKKGEWKTINGAHVFIEEGKSVESALEKLPNNPDKSNKRYDREEYSQLEMQDHVQEDLGIENWRDIKQIYFLEDTFKENPKNAVVELMNGDYIEYNVETGKKKTTKAEDWVEPWNRKEKNQDIDRYSKYSKSLSDEEREKQSKDPNSKLSKMANKADVEIPKIKEEKLNKTIQDGESYTEKKYNAVKSGDKWTSPEDAVADVPNLSLKELNKEYETFRENEIKNTDKASLNQYNGDYLAGLNYEIDAEDFMDMAEDSPNEVVKEDLLKKAKIAQKEAEKNYKNVPNWFFRYKAIQNELGKDTMKI